MTRLACAIATAGILSCTGANAATLTRGIYALIGQVTSTNGNANCSQLNLAQGDASNSTIEFPPAGATKFALYVPTPGSLEICQKFIAQPNAGLNGYSTTASCTIDSVGGDFLPITGVGFTFAAKIVDSNTALGTVQVTIPPDSIIGAGCQATITTTFVRTGQ